MKKIIILLEAIILSICILTPFSVFADSDIYQGLFRFDTLSVKYSDGVLSQVLNRRNFLKKMNLHP